MKTEKANIRKKIRQESKRRRQEAGLNSDSTNGLFLAIEELFRDELSVIEKHYSQAIKQLSLNEDQSYLVAEKITSCADLAVVNPLQGKLLRKSYYYNAFIEKEVRYEVIFPLLPFWKRKIENYQIKSIKINSPGLSNLVDEILSNDLGVVIKSEIYGNPLEPFTIGDFNSIPIFNIQIMISYQKGLKFIEENSRSGSYKQIAYNPDVRNTKNIIDFSG